MIIKWKVMLFGAAEIVRVDCIRETTHIVVCRQDNAEWSARKMSEFEAYFNTWEEAHAYLLQHAEKGLAYLSGQIALAYDKIFKIKQMTAPDEVTK